MNVNREIRLLRFYALANSLLLGVVLIGGCAAQRGNASNGRQRYDEITVERINIVESDGKLRMAISNRDRAPAPVLNGQVMQRQGGNPPGIIFFNDEGDERGGLVYGNNNASFTFDKYKQGELVKFSYAENNEGSQGGLFVFDRPNKPPTPQEMERMMAQERQVHALPPNEQQAAFNRLMDEAAQRGETVGGSTRVFAGKLPDRSAVVMLGDAAGRPRLRLSVTPTGDASIEFLDAAGKVVQRLPPAR